MPEDAQLLWWTFSKDETATNLQTDPQRGLTQAEVLERQKKYGLNQLPKKKRFSILKLILNQFSSFIIWLLLAAIVVAALLKEWIDTIAIAVIVFLNACLGFFQEYRAERSLEALQKLSQPLTKVIREGKIQIIPSHELVPGDVVLLEAGDHIAADGRIIHSAYLATQEAALTGESLPVEKGIEALSDSEAPLGDKKNMAFMGTTVVRGKGKMIVVATGSQSELGKIASLLQSEKEEQTPLQKKLDSLGRRLALICIVIVVFVFAAGLWMGSAFVDSLLIAVSLAVAAIPEGLPAVVTITLAMGVRKMAERHALVRKLSSVETLGCATVICTDKTGTLTQNEMVVRHLWVNQTLIDVRGFGTIPEGNFLVGHRPIEPKESRELLMALEIGLLCNDAELYRDEKTNSWQIRGDPTEAALLVAAKKAGLDRSSLKDYSLKDEWPFDSDRKMMSVLYEKKGEIVLFAKGAPDVILERSDKILINGESIPLTGELLDQVLEANTALANQALRVLGLAFRPLAAQTSSIKSLEEKLTFVGLVAMMDPPRPEAKRALEMCDRAGIKTIMITGDHKETAIAIGRELELLKPGMIVVTGQEAEKMDEETFRKEIAHIGVFARASAELKLKIVRAWKAVGEIVAMTGDGVNDAPAIQEAHIGLAMGQKGTDVTREASDMIILDDNFATIVNAIEEGRGIYDNILKFVIYLLSCNIAEILIIFISILLGFRDDAGNLFIALTAVQLLWLNLVTDGMPAIALSMDPIDPRVMELPPRKPDSPILSLASFSHLFAISCAITIGTLVGSFYGLNHSGALGHTMTFTILVTLELVRVQMVRSQYHMSLFSNPLILVALGSSILLQLMVVYIPFFQRVFGTVALGLKDWGVILAITIAVFFGTLVINQIFERWRPIRPGY